MPNSPFFFDFLQKTGRGRGLSFPQSLSPIRSCECNSSYQYAPTEIALLERPKNHRSFDIFVFCGIFNILSIRFHGKRRAVFWDGCIIDSSHMLPTKRSRLHTCTAMQAKHCLVHFGSFGPFALGLAWHNHVIRTLALVFYNCIWFACACLRLRIFLHWWKAFHKDGSHEIMQRSMSSCKGW